MRKPGIYRCLFENVTSNDTALIVLYDSVTPMSNANSERNKIEKG